LYRKKLCDNLLMIMTDKKAKCQKEMSKKETIKVSADADQVMCDGGGGPLGHPQVWYSFDRRMEVVCHYCGRLFVKEAKTAAQ